MSFATFSAKEVGLRPLTRQSISPIAALKVRRCELEPRKVFGAVARAWCGRIWLYARPAFGGPR
jgi:hypothetical protein